MTQKELKKRLEEIIPLCPREGSLNDDLKDKKKIVKNVIKLFQSLQQENERLKENEISINSDRERFAQLVQKQKTQIKELKEGIEKGIEIDKKDRGNMVMTVQREHLQSLLKKEQ